MMIANKTVSTVKKASAGQLTGIAMASYLILVLLGILGNAMVILVVGGSVIREPGTGRNSDMILVNMALTNLLVSVMRNTLLVTSDFGLEVLRDVLVLQCFEGVLVILMFFLDPLSLLFRRGLQD